MGNMLRSLEAYYRRNGISPLDFRCQHWQACSEGNPRITQAKSAFVGINYAKGVIPRLLFLSFDPGSSEEEPESRTLKSVRDWEKKKCDVNKLLQQRLIHWYYTHELASILLKKVLSITIEDSHLYFAHTNSAKCSVNNDGRKQARPKLFKNCRKYIGGEITILKSDILVTQGNGAKEVVEKEKIFEILPGREDHRLCPYIKWINIGAKQTLWFHTYHPSNYGKFYPQRQECFTKWAKYTYRIFSKMNTGLATPSVPTYEPRMGARACRSCFLTK